MPHNYENGLYIVPKEDKASNNKFIINTGILLLCIWNLFNNKSLQFSIY